MNPIIVTNNIEENKISINFNLQNGEFPFPPFDLLTSGDIELNPLVLKLTELLEFKRKIEFEFIDSNSIVESSSKLKLVQETLSEIYTSFNSGIDVIDPSNPFHANSIDDEII